jgi:CDP-glucose 4,6-dehydratase
MENLVIDLSFWKGRKVFLTGHTGFKGSWISLWLKQLGAEVSGYSLDYPSTASMFYAAEIEKLLKHDIRGDIRDLNFLTKSMQSFQPEIVIHMAAQSLVRESYVDPLNTYTTNIIGTANVFEAVRNTTGVKVVLNITSDKCYENKEWVWGYREDESMGGHDPYSSSKGCAELLIASFRASFFPNEKFNEHKTGIATARAGNVIGGGDWADDRLIPYFNYLPFLNCSNEIRY